MSERKSYLQMMSEGFRMMKEGKQINHETKLRQWTFSISREELACDSPDRALEMGQSGDRSVHH